MSLLSLLSLLVTLLALFVAYRVYTAQVLRLKAQKHGCQPARRYKHKDPIFGLDIFLRTGDAITKNTFLVEHQQRYDTYGHTFEALNFGSSVIYSVHPENLRAVWSQNAADWGIQPLRLSNMRPFCGEGFITTDGLEWKHSRALLKPGFHKSNIADFAPLERHLSMMLNRIPRDGSKFDLQSWFFKLYLDMNTLFLFGEPIGMLSESPPPHAEDFLDAFQAGFNGCGLRIALGPLSFLVPKGSWLKACRKTHQFADVYVKRALEFRDKRDTIENGEAKVNKRTLLYNMAQQTGDKTILRNEIIQAMMAAQETTASLVSNVIRVLATHPSIFKELRSEVLAMGDEPLDFERLSRMKFLRHIINETLRLYPVFPQNNRVALKDTILPVGGGPNGTDPVFAPAGTLFDTCFATIHRDKEIWGPDADEFRPSRWDDGFNPSPYEFMPFGAGLRQCLAQEKATMETSYLTVRMLQEFKEIRSEDERPYQAQAFAFSYCCIVLYGSFNASIGQNLSTITPDEFSIYQKHLYVGVIVAHLSYGLAKLSVLQFYKRIFLIPRFQMSANITIAFVAAFMLTATLVQVFSAWPISNWWTLGKSYSINYGAFITSFAAIDLVLDVIILCLPVPVIRHLQINTHKKFLVIGIFWMGFFCVIATAVRLYFGHQLSLAGNGKPVTDEEFSNASVNNVIWAEIESCCSIIAACLPTYGPLMRSMACPTFISSTLRSLLNSVRRRRSNSGSDMSSSNKNVWFPLSEQRRNFASAKTHEKSEDASIDYREIRVQRGFSTDLMSKNSASSV
ncbi:hypothetical protein ACEQ8H_004739 [Pleosporales sp. CAS-2024a]